MTPAQIKAKELINALLPKPIHEWRDIVAAALEASEAARVKAEQERDALALEESCHDDEIYAWEQQFESDRKEIAALEAERDALKEANRKLHRRVQVMEAPVYSFVWQRHLWVEFLAKCKSYSHGPKGSFNVEKFIEETNAAYAAIRNQEPER